MPTSSVSAVAPIAGGSHVHEQAEQRRRDDQRQPVGHPMRQAFREHGQRQHMPVGDEDSRSSEPSSRSAWNSRSSPSRLASSAPIHRIAGPMRASRSRSGPTPNGMVAMTRGRRARRSAPRRRRGYRGAGRGRRGRSRMNSGGPGVRHSRVPPTPRSLAPAGADGWWVAAAADPARPARCLLPQPRKLPLGARVRIRPSARG